MTPTVQRTAPGRPQAGLHPPGGSDAVRSGRGAGVAGRAPGRPQAGQHPLGGSDAVRSGRGAGFAYIEVLVALVLVVTALVPALEALQIGVRGSQALAGIAAKDPSLRAKMEEVLAKPFETLNAETYLAGGNTLTSVSTSLSDAAGVTDRRLVILYRTDGSALSATDTGLVHVRVVFEAGGIAIESLRSKWW